MYHIDWRALPVGHYRTVYADPPWPEFGGGKIVRGSNRHYPLMKVREIAALPVGDVAYRDAHLYLWTTNRFLPDALEVMRAWGFRYVTCVTWGKVDAHGRIQFGLGQYYRGSTEHCLLGVRGSLPYRTLPDGRRAQGRTLVLAPRGRHSEKPAGMRADIEKVSHGPYLELFARESPEGWDAWGNEPPA